jgi:Putative adhesin
METFATPGKTRVVIYNPHDSVDIVGEGDGTTTVELVARGADSDAQVAETTVVCTESNGVSIITVTLPNGRSFPKRRSAVDVQVAAPRGTDVIVSTTGTERSLLSMARGLGGDIRLRGEVGDVDVSLPSSDLSAQSIMGSLSVKTASGDLTAAKVAGPIKVRTVSGDVDFDEVSDDVSLTVVSGDVSIGSAASHVDVTSISGDVTVTDARNGASVKSTSGDVTVRRAWSGSIRAATVSGDVVVGVPPGRGVTVDARSMSGDLSSEIDLADRSGSGDAGDGTVVKITAHSVSGDIEIQRAPATVS